MMDDKECYRGWELDFSNEGDDLTGEGWYALKGGAVSDAPQVTASSYAELLAAIDKVEGPDWQNGLFPVEQIDRIVAARYGTNGHMDRHVLEGVYDDFGLVQVLAEHRILASTEQVSEPFTKGDAVKFQTAHRVVLCVVDAVFVNGFAIVANEMNDGDRYYIPVEHLTRMD